jgi:hypothetical protein
MPSSFSERFPLVKQFLDDHPHPFALGVRTPGHFLDRQIDDLALPAYGADQLNGLVFSAIVHRLSPPGAKNPRG